MTDRLYIGIDLGTFQSTIASSKGDIHTIETVVGTPKDPVARNMLGRDTLFGEDALKNRLACNIYRPLEAGVAQDDAEHLGTVSKSNPLTYKLPYSRVAKFTLKAAARETFSTMKLQLNGHDRFTVRDADYFRKVQSHQHYDNCPRKYIYNYSFAIKPNEHQPSGTCNFSRIDNAVMNISFSSHHNTHSKTLKIYAINYNVLRIMSGMGGLAYSN